MPNSIFNMMNSGNNMMQMVQQFRQFQQTFRGNPQQQVQQLLNSGKISQSDYNRAVQMAQQLQNVLKGKI